MQSDNVHELGPHSNMSAKEALQLTLREEPEQVIILQVCGCGCGGLCVKSTNMTNAEAVFYLEKARLGTFGASHLGCQHDDPSLTFVPDGEGTADVVEFPE